jgi:hypothetical protein
MDRQRGFGRRFGKFVEVADVIIVHVGEDHVANGAGFQPQQRQALDGAAQKGAFARPRHFGGKTSVDHIGAVAAERDPSVVVHRHRTVVRIPTR